MAQEFKRFDDAINWLGTELYKWGMPIKTEKWQGIEITDTHAMIETLDLSFKCPVIESLPMLRKDIKPNIPWADDHFQERVGRVPLNPGNEFRNWPYYKGKPQNDTFRTEDEKFTHSYMERIWAPTDKMGIRYEYGDFDDVVNLLHKEPLTRQAYLPIWFPEDTGVKFGGRVPCTLGYWFLRRGSLLHITYYIRSCDFIRHLRDDIYLASRKLIWVLEELRRKDPSWNDVMPGNLIMHIGSLHCFQLEKDTTLKSQLKLEEDFYANSRTKRERKQGFIHRALHGRRDDG